MAIDRGEIVDAERVVNGFRDVLRSDRFVGGELGPLVARPVRSAASNARAREWRLGDEFKVRHSSKLLAELDHVLGANALAA